MHVGFGDWWPGQSGHYLCLVSGAFLHNLSTATLQRQPSRDCSPRKSRSGGRKLGCTNDGWHSCLIKALCTMFGWPGCGARRGGGRAGGGGDDKSRAVGPGRVISCLTPSVQMAHPDIRITERNLSFFLFCQKWVTEKEKAPFNPLETVWNYLKFKARKKSLWLELHQELETLVRRNCHRRKV